MLQCYIFDDPMLWRNNKNPTNKAFSKKMKIFLKIFGKMFGGTKFLP